MGVLCAQYRLEAGGNATSPTTPTPESQETRAAATKLQDGRRRQFCWGSGKTSQSSGGYRDNGAAWVRLCAGPGQRPRSGNDLQDPERAPVWLPGGLGAGRTPDQAQGQSQLLAHLCPLPCSSKGPQLSLPASRLLRCDPAGQLLNSPGHNLTPAPARPCQALSAPHGACDPVGVDSTAGQMGPGSPASCP